MRITQSIQRFFRFGKAHSLTFNALPESGPLRVGRLRVGRKLFNVDASERSQHALGGTLLSRAPFNTALIESVASERSSITESLFAERGTPLRLLVAAAEFPPFCSNLRLRQRRYPRRPERNNIEASAARSRLIANG
jgi:hypothetical protein